MESGRLREIGVWNFILVIFQFFIFETIYFPNLDFKFNIFYYSNEGVLLVLYPLFSLLTIGLLFEIISSITMFYLSLTRSIIFKSVGLLIISLGMLLPVLVILIKVSFFDALEFFFFFILPVISFLLLMQLIKEKSKKNYVKQGLIKEEILNIGTKYPDFKLYAIARNCYSDQDIVLETVKGMIKNKEIYAEYFKNSNKFVFNNRANMEEIDNLMKKFKKWEEENLLKIKKS